MNTTSPLIILRRQTMNEKYFICDIQEEDLEVVEKWLIKVSIIEEPVDEEDGLVRRVLVFELVQEILSDEQQKALELNYEICKLPLYLSRRDVRMLTANGRFTKEVDK